jgi:hypothetical protein
MKPIQTFLRILVPVIAIMFLLVVFQLKNAEKILQQWNPKMEKEVFETNEIQYIKVYFNIENSLKKKIFFILRNLYPSKVVFSFGQCMMG